MTIAELRNKVIAQNDYTSFLGDPKTYSDLSASEQIKVTNDMDSYIVANPGEFTADQVAKASKVTSAGGITATSDYTLADAAGDFGNEVANQAVAINNDLNPFSEQNRKTVFFLVLSGLFVYFVGPILIKTFVESKGAKAPSVPVI